jgi:hypothetical protein
MGIGSMQMSPPGREIDFFGVPPGREIDFSASRPGGFRDRDRNSRICPGDLSEKISDFSTAARAEFFGIPGRDQASGRGG